MKQEEEIIRINDIQIMTEGKIGIDNATTEVDQMIGRGLGGTIVMIGEGDDNMIIITMIMIRKIKVYIRTDFEIFISVTYNSAM